LIVAAMFSIAAASATTRAASRGSINRASNRSANSPSASRTSDNVEHMFVFYKGGLTTTSAPISGARGGRFFVIAGEADCGR